MPSEKDALDLSSGGKSLKKTQVQFDDHSVLVKNVSTHTPLRGRNIDAGHTAETLSNRVSESVNFTETFPNQASPSVDLKHHQKTFTSPLHPEYHSGDKTGFDSLPGNAKQVGDHDRTCNEGGASVAQAGPVPDRYARKQSRRAKSKSVSGSEAPECADKDHGDQLPKTPPARADEEDKQSIKVAQDGDKVRPPSVSPPFHEKEDQERLEIRRSPFSENNRGVAVSPLSLSQRRSRWQDRSQATGDDIVSPGVVSRLSEKELDPCHPTCPSESAMLNASDPTQSAAVGLCESCRFVIPFNSPANASLLHGDVPVKDIGVTPQWGLANPPPVPVRGDSFSAGLVRRSEQKRFKDGHFIFEDSKLQPNKGAIILHEETAGPRGDHAIFEPAYQEIAELHFNQFFPEDFYDDRVFPTEHRLGSSEGLQAAIENVRREDRRKSYRGKMVLGTSIVTSPHNVISCTARFPHTTRGELQVKYRHILAQIRRKFYKDWETDISSRAGALRPLIEISESNRVSSSGNLNDRSHSSAQYNTSNVYGKPNAPCGRRISSSHNSIVPRPSVVSEEIKPQPESLFPQDKSRQSATDSPLSIAIGKTVESPSSTLKAARDSVTLRSRSSCDKSGPSADKVPWPFCNSTQKPQMMNRDAHPTKCICTACCKVAHWVNTMGLSCYTDNQSPSGRASKDAMGSKAVMLCRQNKDTTVASEDQSEESVQLSSVRKKRSTKLEPVRRWEITKLEDQLKPRYSLDFQYMNVSKVQNKAADGKEGDVKKPLS